MTNTIKVLVGYFEKNNTYLRREFTIKDEFPEIGDTLYGEEIVEVNEVKLDVEERNEKAFNYKYYEVTTVDEEENQSIEYIAVKYDMDREIIEECIGKSWGWISDDDYYKSVLLNETHITFADTCEDIFATVLDEEDLEDEDKLNSKDCTIDLSGGLSVSGKLIESDDELVAYIPEDSVVYRP